VRGSISTRRRHHRNMELDVSFINIAHSSHEDYDDEVRTYEKKASKR